MSDKIKSRIIPKVILFSKNFQVMEQDYINILWISIVILILILVNGSCMSRTEDFTIDVIVECELPMYSVEDQERPPVYSVT